MLVFSQCQKTLEVEPKTVIENSQAIVNYQDLEAVMNGVYDKLQSGNVLGGNQMVYGDLLSEDTEVRTNNLRSFSTLEIYNRSMSIQLNSLRSMWAENYSAVNACNNVIAAIDNNEVSGIDFEANKDRLKGEALFVRSFIYYNLLQFWSAPYVPGEANDHAGIVLRDLPTLDKDQVLDKARSSVADCYATITADLMTSVQLLETAGQTKMLNRGSSLAADALLARVYLQISDFQNAAFYAEKVITSGEFGLEDSAHVAHQSVYGEFSDETLFQLEYTITEGQGAAMNENYNRVSSANLFLAEKDLRDLYDSSDARLISLLTPFFSLTYINKHDQPGIEPINICLIRLAEMHLIRAEANMSPGGSSDDLIALESYNAIRGRAFAGDTNFVADTIVPADFLTKIKEERRKELCFEGFRYNDLRRWQLPMRDGIAYNDPTLLFKIPQEEMAGNSLVEQNP